MHPDELSLGAWSLDRGVPGFVDLGRWASASVGPAPSADGVSYSVAAGGFAVGRTWTTKPGGGAWTDADVDSLQAGIEFASGGTASTVRVSQVYVTVNVGDSVTYTYADGTAGMNTLSSLVRNDASLSFAYDANGNLDTTTSGWDYDWNAENLMTVAKLNGIQQQAYVYDGLGRRTKVEGSDSTAWTVSIYSDQDVIFEKDQAGRTTKYVYAAGLRIARIDCTAANPPTCTTYYYHGDALGSTRKMTKHARGAPLVFSAEYDPFGKPVNVQGTLAESFQFTSEKHDDPTGLVYLRARQYDPDLGRFVSADPVLGSLSAPQTLNRYAYVVNNPLKYTDPTGEAINLIAAGIGALAGAIIGGVACAASQGWSWSDQCWIAMGAGAAAGGPAGLTFGASLALTGAAGLGTTGLSGLAAATFAGPTSGAVYGTTEYLVGSALTGSEITAQGLVNAAGSGIISGAIGGAAGFGVSRLWVRFNVWRFNRAFGQTQGASDIADAALAGDEHAFGVVRASLRLGPARVTGFGGRAQPDIFVTGGLKNPNARWVEVKAGSVKPPQMRDYTQRSGPGEYAFYNIPGYVNRAGIGTLGRAGLPHWYTW